jgi:glycosyltransferase involved in cell wall biosynthesis
MLHVLQERRKVTLICPTAAAGYVDRMRGMFGFDLHDVAILPANVTRETDIAQHVPADASFFQVCNGVPLDIACAHRVLHHQVQCPRLDEAQARGLFPSLTPSGANDEVRRRFCAQDLIVFSSECMRDFMVREWGLDSARCVVIYPSVSEAFFAQAPVDRPPTIICVGRFEAIKMQAPQLDVLKTLLAHAPHGLRLLLVGSSKTALAESLEQRSRGLPVEFRYGLAEPEMVRAYQSAAILWSTTGLSVSTEEREHKVESFGLAIAEGMACGCVPIAIEAGGVREVIEHGKSGFLIRTLPEMAVVTLELLRRPPALAAASAASTLRAKCFSFEVFRRRVLEAFGS